MEISPKLKQHLEAGRFQASGPEVVRWDEKGRWLYDISPENFGKELTPKQHTLLLRTYRLDSSEFPQEVIRFMPPKLLTEKALERFDAHVPRLAEEKLEGLDAKKKYPYMERATSYWNVAHIAKTLNSGGELSAIDPRTGTTTLYAPRRANRPRIFNADGCKICEGDTTQVIARKKLGLDLYSFANFNLFGFLNPNSCADSTNGIRVKGVGLMVWPTTQHKDIHQLSPDENTVSFELLSELERELQQTSGDSGFNKVEYPDGPRHGYVQIIKNTGRAVGGSIEHGHYQLGFLNIPPKRIVDDMKFMKRRNGRSFVRSLAGELDKNKDLEIADYGRVISVVPPFMRRPLEVIIMPKDLSKENLSSGEDLSKDFAKAATDVSRSLYHLMPAMGREFAFNMVFHTGPIGTMYIEVLPYTQEDGGFERAGLNVCQSLPRESARLHRDCIEKYVRKKPASAYAITNKDMALAVEVRESLFHTH